jgi:hypothetical protein
MANTATTTTDTEVSSVSAVSWAAVFAGAITAAATTLLLLVLGSGFGLAAISPWPRMGASATNFTIAAGISLIVVQWISAGVGGYITGRLRIRWHSTHAHEVFFRDTAHGFLTWSLATVIGAGMLASAVTSVAGTATRAASSMAAGATQAVGAVAHDYAMDTLMRGDKPELVASQASVRDAAMRILATGANGGTVSAPDKAYLAQQIASRTGISPDDATKRIDDVITREKAAETKARVAADAARKAASETAIFTGIAMLIGAFVACAAAALGGRLRDEHA